MDHVSHEAHPKKGQFESRRAHWLMEHLGREWCGYKGPPLTNRTLYVLEDGSLTRVVATQDDGGFVGIGYPDEWHVSMRWPTARIFAWRVLRWWAADWFGLRSALYYRALNRWCNGSWSRLGARDHELVRVSSYDEWKAKEPAKQLSEVGR